MTDKVPWSVSELAEQGGYVIHEPTGTVGRATKLWTGVPGDRWRSPANDRDVEAPVLQLDTGDAFLLKEDAFTPLTRKESDLFEKMQGALTSAMTVGGHLAAAAQIPLEQFVRLGVAALKIQQRALGG